MASITKLRDAARKHLSAGKLDRAAQAYTKLSLAEAKNPRWPHKLGEVYQRLDDRAGAISAYEDAVIRYAQQGFLLKAIAMCKMILTLDAGHQTTQELLAELYARQHKRPLARTERLTAASRRGGPDAPTENASNQSASFAGSDAMLDHGTIDLPEHEVEPLEISAELPSQRREQANAPAVPAPMDHTQDGLALIVEDEDDGMDGIVGTTLDAIDLAEVLDAVPPVPGDAAMAESDILAISIDEIDAAFDAMGDGAQDGVMDQLPPTPLFSSLDKPALRMLIEKVEVSTHAAGDVLIRQGTSGTSLFVLVDGNVAVYRQDADGAAQELAQLGEGAFFGEIALLTELERSATVQALDECIVLEIRREVIQQLIAEHPAVLKVLLRFFRERLVGVLADTHPLFSPFSAGERVALTQRFAFVEAQPGATIVQQGQLVDGLYLLVCGKAQLAGSKGERVLVLGEVFGEGSLINNEASSYSVVAQEKCWLLKLPRDEFRQVIMTHPMVLAVLADVSARLLSAEQLLPIV